MKKILYMTILAFVASSCCSECIKAQIIFNDITAQTTTSNIGSYSQSPGNNKNTAVNYKYMKKNQGRIDQYLKLSDEQEQQSKQIRVDGMKKMKPLYDVLYQENRKLNKLKLNNGTFSEIDAQKKIVNELHKNIDEIQNQNMTQYIELLTPEQKQKFDEFQKKRMMQIKSVD